MYTEGDAKNRRKGRLRGCKSLSTGIERLINVSPTRVYATTHCSLAGKKSPIFRQSETTPLTPYQKWVSLTKSRERLEIDPLNYADSSEASEVQRMRVK